MQDRIEARAEFDATKAARSPRKRERRPNQTYGTNVVTGLDLPNAIGKETYIVGCTAYRDQFSEPHWTKFCYNTGDFAKDVVKDASSFKHLYLCNANNYTDEAENKQPSCPVAAE